MNWRRHNSSQTVRYLNEDLNEYTPTSGVKTLSSFVLVAFYYGGKIWQNLYGFLLFSSRMIGPLNGGFGGFQPWATGKNMQKFDSSLCLIVCSLTEQYFFTKFTLAVRMESWAGMGPSFFVIVVSGRGLTVVS